MNLDRPIFRNDGWSEVLGIRHSFVHDKQSAVHITLTDKLEG